MSAYVAQELSSAPARARSRVPATWLMAPLLLALGALVFYPVILIIVRAVAPDGHLDWALWADTLSAPGLLAAVRNTAILAATTTAIAVPVGVFFAWLIERTDARWGSLSRLLPVIPLLLPPVAMAIGWLFLVDPRAGFLARPLIEAMQAAGIAVEADQVAIQSWAGLIFLYALWAVPHVYVIAAAAFSGLDPSLEEAARMFGKGRLRCFAQVSLPAIRHAVGSSVLVCVISSIGLYSIAALIGSAARIEVLSVYIYRLLNFSYPPKTAQAVIIGLLLMGVIASIWLLQRRIAARTGHAQIGGMGVRPNLLALGGWRWPARLAVLLYVLLTSVLPLLALVVVALQPFWRSRIVLADLALDNFAEFGASSAARDAIWNSTMLAICAATAAVLAAGLIAVVARHAGGRREQALGIVTKVPAAIPHIGFAVGVLVAFGFAPFRLGGTWLILLLAYVAIYLPTASIAAESSVQQIGNQLTEASRIFGASPVRTFRAVQLPLILPGLAAGWASIFALVLGELNAAAILSGPRNPVIGYLILTLFDNGTYSQLAAIGSIIGVVSAIAVSAVLLLGRPHFARSATA